MGGASCVAAVQCAVAAISAGICRHVLIPLGRNGASESRIGTRVRQSPQFRMVGEFEMPIGALAPAQLYAPMARRHMELYGTTSRQLGEIAVTSRGAPRQRDDDDAHHARGPSAVADDCRPAAPARLQPRERRRRRGGRECCRARPSHEQLLRRRPPLTATSEPAASRGSGPFASIRRPPLVLTRDTPLIGRDQEMARLRAALAETVSGQGRVVALTGEAGVGKTRLVAELAAEVLADSMGVLVG
jgi:AAA ATPase domain